MNHNNMEKLIEKLGHEFPERPIKMTNMQCLLGRRVGNTTRQVDWAIQELFNRAVVIVTDHYDYDPRRDEGARRIANMDLFNRVIFRIKHEHPGIELIANSKDFYILIK